jgi:hypothetical protein
VKSLTASAHLEPDSTSQAHVIDATDDGGAFVSLRIGGKLVDIALIARPGTAGALRALARAADEAASAPDQIAARTTDGDT